jgi:hypothetical protein
MAVDGRSPLAGHPAIEGVDAVDAQPPLFDRRAHRPSFMDRPY